MDVRNCRGCGKLYNYIGGTPLCPKCIKELDEKFSVVKQYIYDNPMATIQQISEENDVSIQQLNNWVREERLSFSEDSMIGIECENCGTMIRTGRFCQSCKEKLANSLSNAYRKEPQAPQKNIKENAKMRFLDSQGRLDL